MKEYNKLKKSLLFILVGMVLAGLFFCTALIVEDNTSEYTVTFKFSDEGGGEPTVFQQVVQEGSKVSKPNDPVKSGGASFHGWFTDSSYDKDTLDENIYDFDLLVSNDFTLYGRWTYTIIFDSKEGDSVSNSIVGEGLKLQSNIPSKTGYYFGGWTTDSNGTEAYDFNLPVSNSFTLYAVWDLSGYTVTFDFQDGVTPVVEKKITSGMQIMQLSSVPSRSGYEFLGWINSSGDSYDFSTPVNSDLTLYANWIRLFEVTFLNDGGVIAVQSVREGSNASFVNGLSRSGYEFLGWANSSGDSYDFSTPVNSDLTLYANWIRLFEVTFLNDEEVIAVQSVREGSNASSVKANNGPSRSGYEFLAWIKVSGIDYDFSTPVTSDLTLHAKWLGWNLARIARDREIPANFNNYDEKSIYVLSGKYASGTPVGSYYVTANGNGNKDGSSWINAVPFNNLEGIINGITDASDTKVYLIFVAAGETHTPQSPLSMKDHVVIVGGYDSLGRGYSKEKTVFDGDDRIRLFENINNNLTEKAVLLDVIIQKGRSTVKGGGMYNENSSPSLMYVTFLNNQAEDGGGLAAIFDSSSKFKNVYFSNNIATFKGGGAFFDARNTAYIMKLSFKDAVFSGNEAGDASSKDFGGGGGIFLQAYNGQTASSIPHQVLFEKVIFVSNFSYRGAGILQYGGLGEYNNVTFLYNKAEQYGGGVYGYQLGDTVIKNSAFVGNKAQRTGGCALYFSASASTLMVVNTTFVGQCRDGQTSFGAIASQGSALKLINITSYDNEDSGSVSVIYYDSHLKTSLDEEYPSIVSIGEGGVFVLNSIIWSPNNVKIKFNLADTEKLGAEHLIFSYNIFKKNDYGNWDFQPPCPRPDGLCFSDRRYLELAEHEVYYDENPQLGSLNNEGGIYTLPIPGNSFAKNKGIYVQYDKTSQLLYFSEDNVNWYKTLDNVSGALEPIDKVSLPNSAEPLNYTDARGYTRVGRPDLGAYEAGGIPPSP